jgi:hypothetical protein
LRRALPNGFRRMSESPENPRSKKKSIISSRCAAFCPSITHKGIALTRSGYRD